MTAGTDLRRSPLVYLLDAEGTTVYAESGPAELIEELARRMYASRYRDFTHRAIRSTIPSSSARRLRPVDLMTCRIAT